MFKNSVYVYSTHSTVQGTPVQGYPGPEPGPELVLKSGLWGYSYRYTMTPWKTQRKYMG
jgi:hypothetical protein